MIVDKEILHNHGLPFTLFVVQLVLAFFAVYQFLAIIGFAFNPTTRELSFGLSPDPMVYVFLLLVLALLYAVYSLSRKKYEDVFVATTLLPFQLKSTTKFKLWLAKNEPRVAALLLIQFSFIVVVIMSLYIYLDPDISIIQWDKLGVFPPFTTILNALLFLIVIAILNWLYKFTSFYRAERTKLQEK